MSKKEETVFKERVLRDLKKIRDLVVIKIQQVCKRGDPDIICCAAGKFVAIELKKDKEAIVAPIQMWTLELIASSGGHSYLAYPTNWENTLKDIREIVKENQERGYYERDKYRVYS